MEIERPLPVQRAEDEMDAAAGCSSAAAGAIAAGRLQAVVLPHIHELAHEDCMGLQAAPDQTTDCAHSSLGCQCSALSPSCSASWLSVAARLPRRSPHSTNKSHRGLTAGRPCARAAWQTSQAAGICVIPLLMLIPLLMRRQPLPLMQMARHSFGQTQPQLPCLLQAAKQHQMSITQTSACRCIPAQWAGSSHTVPTRQPQQGPQPGVRWQRRP